jgi:hypothetical protein
MKHNKQKAKKFIKSKITYFETSVDAISPSGCSYGTNSISHHLECNTIKDR